MPFLYGRWDQAAQAHAMVGLSERARAVRAAFAADGASTPSAHRSSVPGNSAALS